MKRFCINCGAELSIGSKFCMKCGCPASQESEDARPDASGALSSSTELPGKVITSERIGGEMVFAGVDVGAVQGLPERISPFGALAGGVKSIFRNISSVFGNKRKLIPAVVLSVIWAILIIMKSVGYDPFPVQIISILTFAHGGLSSSISHIIGGVIGKGLVAALVMSLFSGGFMSSTGRGIKRFFQSLNIGKPQAAGFFLVGAGVAFILYNFAAGFASIGQSMAAFSALLLSLRALGSQAGFLRSFIGGIITRKGSQVNVMSLNKIVSGMAVGFLVAIPLSAIPFAYTPYLIGAIALIAGTVLAIAGGKSKEVAK